MTHHGDETEHEGTTPESQQGDAPVGGTLGTTGTEGYGMPEQVVGDGLHTDERAQTAEESVTRGTVGAQVAGGFAVTGLAHDQPGGGLSPEGGAGADENLPPSRDRNAGAGPGSDLGGGSAGVPGDQVTSDGGVSSDPLDGQNATGGYGDESTGLSDEASSDAPPVDGDPGGDFAADADLIDRDPGEDATTVTGGNADR